MKAQKNRLHEVNNYTFRYRDYTINTSERLCSCKRFLDKAMCKYYVAVCLIKDISLDGLVKENLMRLRKRMRRGRKAGQSDDEIEVEDSLNLNISKLIDNDNILTLNSTEIVNVKNVNNINNIKNNNFVLNNILIESPIKSKGPIAENGKSS